jgi:hypothetical protein
MLMRQRLSGRFVPGFVALIVAASLVGCDVDGGSGVLSAQEGAAGRDEELASPPVVTPPADPDPYPADPFDEEEPPTNGGPPINPDSEAGEPGPHFGELKQLSVKIQFSGASGTTVTDEDGITYASGSWSAREDKVYPSEYWGMFPLYFFGQEVGITVTVTNLGPRNKFKLVIRTEAYCLRTDGSNGATLLAPTDTEIEVLRGETVVVDSSFTADFVEGAESGLDRLIVKVLHPNVADNGSDGESALILQKEAVFCPPEDGPPAGGDAF